MKILLVDDEEPIRRLLGKLLRAEGFEVVVAANGLEAIGIAVADPPDVVLMDLDMPGMEGSEAIAKLRANGPTEHIPVLVLTGVSTEENVVRARSVGADGFIVKPDFNLPTLLQRIRDAVDRRKGSSGSSTGPGGRELKDPGS